MKKFIAASPVLFVLAACSLLTQPTATAIPTSINSAIPTLIPSLTPINTPLPQTGTEELPATPVPEGQAAAEWNGIPVMPGAIEGKGDEEGYVFTIRAAPQQVEEYYRTELGKLGWEPFAQGNGEASLMLMFIDSASVILTVNIKGDGEGSMVLLVK